LQVLAVQCCIEGLDADRTLLAPPVLLLLPLLLLLLLAPGKHAKVFWQSLFIENAAPGNALSSLLSRPMSSAVSAGMYAIYCDR
jgi:purine-cytosine permease-like protein